MSTPSPPPIVTADEVTRAYATARGTVTAVHEVSLTVTPRQILGISGPSGSGKSTLLRLLAGIERPDTGTIHFAGQPAWTGRSRTARYPRPGYVMPIFQAPSASLNPRWPIWRSITEPLTAPGRDRQHPAQLRATAADWLDRARLGHVDPTIRPGDLSGGQCQRIAILRALVAQPALVIADEPTARQDVITAAAISELLTHAAAHGTGLVVVSHDTAWLDTFAHHTHRMTP
ncbi:ATP-binding cassette domain-containing protein [Actinoplanes sp. NPDC051346]|uniref:ATP-binding cassette domain-containing protein n=1 Tax=Actinoplanes sp. NPDC051346 TaxID=3155048 RepID=UPI003420F93F